LLGFFKKPFWFGPLVAGLSMAVGHPGEPKYTGSVGASAYQRVNNSGALPRLGRIVVLAVCPAGKRLIGGGYVLPSTLASATSSRPKGMQAWRVDFKSYGGSGEATAYAICVTEKISKAE
jgi:hypothetical protein